MIQIVQYLLLKSREALYKIMQRMPADAKNYAAVLTGLMNITPEKRKALVK